MKNKLVIEVFPTTDDPDNLLGKWAESIIEARFREIIGLERMIVWWDRVDE